MTGKTIEVKATATRVRSEFSEWVNAVRYGNRWLVLLRHGKPVVAMISVEDLAVLRKLEDKLDLAAAREALKETGEVPWSKVKARLGL